MNDTPRLVAWLEDLRALNGLFLDHLAALAREGRPCLDLPSGVARRLRDASPAMLERIADLPVALFRIDLAARPVEHALPRDRYEQARWSLTLTILSSARHLARSHPLEARTFLHLAADELQCLQSTPVVALAPLARSPSIITCAFGDALTWPALVRLDSVDDERMLTMIALQPPPAAAQSLPAHEAMRRSV